MSMHSLSNHSFLQLCVGQFADRLGGHRRVFAIDGMHVLDQAAFRETPRLARVFAAVHETGPHLHGGAAAHGPDILRLHHAIDRRMRSHGHGGRAVLAVDVFGRDLVHAAIMATRAGFEAEGDAAAGGGEVFKMKIVRPMKLGQAVARAGVDALEIADQTGGGLVDLPLVAARHLGGNEIPAQWVVQWSTTYIPSIMKLRHLHATSTISLLPYPSDMQRERNTLRERRLPSSLSGSAAIRVLVED